MSAPDAVLSELYATLASRRDADPASSYVAGLLQAGPDAVLRKAGEEFVETLLAAKDGDRTALVHELADLWFHTLVLMVSAGVPLDEVTGELSRRRGTSGLVEKAGRPPSKE